jgi:hypothetical protein
LLRASNFRTPARPAGFENYCLWSIGESGCLLRHVRSTPMLLQKSKVASVPNFWGNLKREAIDGSRNLSRDAEVAYEFSVRP